MIDPSAPGISFESLWAELPAIQSSGAVFGKFHGRPFSISAVADDSVLIDSEDIGGAFEIPRPTLLWVYSNWKKYRYEELSRDNSQLTLHAVSLIDYVVQTWVRRENRERVIELARSLKLCDGVFRVVSYNERGRHIGPGPSGELISLEDVFPDEQPSAISSLESSALRLFGDPSMSQGDLACRYPGYSAEIYGAVVMKNQISNR